MMGQAVVPTNCYWIDTLKDADGAIKFNVVQVESACITTSQLPN